MKKYLLSYSSSLGSRDKLVKVLNTLSVIKGWRYDMPNCFYILSESSAMELMNAIRSACGGKGRGVIVEMEHYYGWLPRETWDFIHKSDKVSADK